MTQANEIDLLATRVPSEQVVASPVGDVTVLLDLRSGTYYTLNDLGAFIWGALQRGQALGEIVDEICSAYDVNRDQVLGDTQRFFAEIDTAGLAQRR